MKAGKSLKYHLHLLRVCHCLELPCLSSPHISSLQSHAFPSEHWPAEDGGVGITLQQASTVDSLLWYCSRNLDFITGMKQNRSEEAC